MLKCDRCPALADVDGGVEPLRLFVGKVGGESLAVASERIVLAEASGDLCRACRSKLASDLAGLMDRYGFRPKPVVSVSVRSVD